MTAPREHVEHSHPDGNDQHGRPVTFDKPRASDGHAGHRGHGWMMIACCIPMLIIAFALVAAGIASPSFIVAALACTAMMALMMRAMHN